VRPRDRISLAIGGAALLVSVLVIGGALRWTQAVVAGLFALALVMQLGSRRRLDHVSPLVVLLPRGRPHARAADPVAGRAARRARPAW